MNLYTSKIILREQLTAHLWKNYNIFFYVSSEIRCEIVSIFYPKVKVLPGRIMLQFEMLNTSNFENDKNLS